MVIKDKIKILGLVTCFLFAFFSNGFLFAGDRQLPPAKPFENLQQQIDDLKSRLFGQSCPEGEFMTGFDSEGNLICSGPELAGDIVAYGMGQEDHLARSYIKITQNLQQTEYIMGCQRSDNMTGPVGTDPFSASHANYILEFGPALIGAALDAIAVEISSIGNSDAYVELKDIDTGNVLATSNTAPTYPAGWIEFTFTPNFIIDESQILVLFVTSNDARIYNCSNIVEFIPQ
jgi:hypothetical protein